MSHSMAVTSNGQVLTWGGNMYGNLGDNGSSSSDRPVKAAMPSNTTTVQVAAGNSFSLALTSAGDLYTWGLSDWGQLGDGNQGDYARAFPKQVPIAWSSLGMPAGTTLTKIAASGTNSHALAITSTGQIIGWGFNLWGQLGDGTGAQMRATPVNLDYQNIPDNTTFVDIAAGYGQSLAITDHGTLYSWGSNSSGELGNGGTSDSNVPTPLSLDGLGLPPDTKFTAVAAGQDYSLANRQLLKVSRGNDKTLVG